MIKETDGDHFEEMRSLEQNLTFERARKEFEDQNKNLKAKSYIMHNGKTCGKWIILK